MLFASRALCVLFLCIYCFIPAFAQANANEIDVRQAVEEETSRLLTKRDYRALERLYLKYQDTSERTPSGAWKLYFFDAALNTFIQQNAVRPPKPSDQESQDFAIKGFFANWWNASPNSELRNLMQAKLSMQQVYLARRGRFFKDVSAEDRMLEERYLMRAGGTLKDAIQQGKAKVLTYREYMNYVGWAHGYGEVYQKEMAKVLALYPAYHANYFFSTPYIQPQWTGQSKEKTRQLLEDFVQQAVRLNQDGESIALYARIYWNHNQAITQGRLFQETNAIWPLMKQGFEKLTSLFPTPHNYSAFAYFSCLSGDIESFKKLKLEHNAGSTMTGWGSSATGLGSQAFEAECSAR